ncbi:hypothetical protein I6N95_16840 [Vagococcus sp. BWB3-3]|uniref:Regulatory protein YycH domain-containing protein n=1 Tax=Vagococcus allomyrinae TaxID=2794353 RepID=A0A940PD92_9ENTE|nr:two-component system activity regulator YycH [Vagococcus allomyrinae]MBP1042685.1 hypothetical protein [Vagococcus allomyrinae]
MKLGGRLIRFGLVSMIVLSLFLSWKIWTNSGSKDLVDNSKNSESTMNMKQPKDVFSPVKLIYHDDQGKHFYSNKENLISSITKEVLRLSRERLTVYSEKDGARYLESQTKPNSFELVMGSPISLAYFLEINDQDVTRGIEEDMSFQRLVVSLDEDVMYVLNDKNQQVYRIKFKGDLSEIRRLLRDTNNRFIEVLHEDSELPVFYQFIEDITLKKYSYILSTQSYTLFSQAFFDNPQEIMPNDSNRNSRDVDLINAEGDSLKISYDTGEAQFSGRIKPETVLVNPTHNIYTDTFYYVQSIGNSMGTIRYFEGRGNKVTYRNFVEGFPIFSDHTKGRVEVTRNNQIIQVMTNQETIQVPIPSDEEVTLPNTERIVAQLEAAGIQRKELEDLQIGYTWEANQETKQVVDLVPEWYVKLDNYWDNVANVIQKAQEMGGKE